MQTRVKLGATRRGVIKGAAGLAVLGTTVGLGIPNALGASVDDDLRAKVMQTPGVGKGSPTDADWQKVGELCLGPTKANVAPGEFQGVEFNFMGIQNQNVHNVMFRGLLKAWVDYTGAKINWIDVAQDDFFSRLKQSIAAGTVDFDVVEMGAALEGDLFTKELASEVPDWVKAQIQMEEYVEYLKPPTGSWGGKTYRVSIDGDCHFINYRTDYFADPTLAKAWAAEGGQGAWAPPRTWAQVLSVTKFLKGKKFGGQDAYGYLDVGRPWGGFSFYYLMSRATAYAKHPADPAWLFDSDTMKPRINNPAFVRAVQDVVDALPFEPPGQGNADPNTVAFQQLLAGIGSMTVAWGDPGDSAMTDISVVGSSLGFDILPGSDDVYNAKTGAWDKLQSGPNFAPNCAFLGWGLYVMKRAAADPKRHRAAWSAVAHLGGKDLSLWTVAYPSGFQPYRKSHFNIEEWVRAGYDRRFITSWLNAQSQSYNHPNRAIEPRIPGIFQYYSLAEDEISRIYTGQIGVKAGLDNIAARWEKLTDQIGRESQIANYKSSFGT